LCNFTRNAATCVLCSPFWIQKFDDNGENPKATKVMNFMLTADHRFIDGATGAYMNTGIKAVWSNPELFDVPYDVLEKRHGYGSKPVKKPIRGNANPVDEKKKED